MSRLLVVCLVAGCARGPGPGPATAVRSWLDAGDDPHAAYQLLSRSLRRSVSEAEFATRWRSQASERKAQVAALGPLTTRPPQEKARSIWSDGRAAELIRDPAGWRLAAPRVATSGAASPEEALRQFAQTLERHDLDGLLDLLGDPLRSLVERELSDRLSKLKGASPKEIQVDGARARIRLDERYYLELKREGGRWRVSDFN